MDKSLTKTNKRPAPPRRSRRKITAAAAETGPAQAAAAETKPAAAVKPVMKAAAKFAAKPAGAGAKAAALPAKAEAAAAPASAAAAEAQQAGSFRRELLSLLPNLRAFAVSLSGRADRADDLLQDTIMRAWAKQNSYRPGTNMKAWLFTILRNEFYSQIRRAGREVQDTDGYFANNLAVHPAQYGTMDLQDFKIALDKLPTDQREAIILIGASGFSYEEAAVICHCALGTVKSRVSRARARLQALLGIKGESDYGPDSFSAGATLRSY